MGIVVQLMQGPRASGAPEAWAWGACALAQPVPACYVSPVPRMENIVSQPVDEAPMDVDVALVQRLARGDRAALSELYDRYSSVLLAVGQRVLSNRREAEDLLHDVFLEVWRHAGEYDVSRGSVRAWLLMRMRSRALDRKRSEGRSRVVLAEDGTLPEGPEVHAEDPALGPDRARVRAALAALPDDQRRVLELGYFEGLSSTEIAKEVSIPVGTVKSRVARGLSELRAKLAEGSSEGRAWRS